MPGRRVGAVVHGGGRVDGDAAVEVVVAPVGCVTLPVYPPRALRGKCSAPRVHLATNYSSALPHVM